MIGDHKNAAAVELYRSMRLIRRAEEILIDEYHPANEMRCPIHFCVGQEAAPASVGLALQPKDVIFSHYRSHGYYLAKGAPLDAMVAEFYGKQSGSNGGLAGSMELAHHGSHLYSGAIVAGPVALAVGSAAAQKYLKSGAITVAAFGDGAMDEGVVYEAVNLAVLRHVPVLFLCENNLYAAHTPLPNRAGTPSPHSRASAFGIATECIEDEDPLNLQVRIAKIVDRVRSAGEPFFLEVKTYRFCGHVGPEGDDDMGYRPAEEIAGRIAKDPLARLRRDLLAQGIDGTLLGAIDAETDKRVHAAIAAAKTAPFPTPDWAASTVSAGTFDPVVKNFIEGPVGSFHGAQSETKLAPY